MSLPTRPISKYYEHNEDIHLASPSKARALAAEFQQWSLIKSWLARLYHPHSVPSFEHNSSTLEYLQSLRHANESADAERELLHHARLEELELYQALEIQRRDRQDMPTDLLREIESSLTSEAQAALQSLAKTAISLGMLPPYTTSSLLTRLTELTEISFAAEQKSLELSHFTQSTLRETAQVDQALSDLKSLTDEASTELMHSQTAQWQRETKQLSLKIAEYQDRGGGLERWKIDGPMIEDVNAQEQIVDQMRNQVKTLEGRLLVYHGLPPDVDVSREEVRRAQRELDELKRKREGLFGRMIEP